ncbi:MAG: bifunctional 4-hydroxy-2-oxoglutarate aldolase/2-dehydro-3-deoxy-phosphogluconate aldolase [Verrucomicrobiota bacterium]|jgi:2-dehydro-3-deoxyphosphogluconate aldolase/(4S)-4-hydroxy-2-oxoglutarate aldolase
MSIFDFEPVLAGKIISVITIDRAEDAEPLAQALIDGGLDALEITFRTEAAPEAIRRIKSAFPNAHLGAGTLLTCEQVKIALNAGATFGLAPGLNSEVIRFAHEHRLGFIPGVMTPSEVEIALSLGCHVQKFFPADIAGGVRMLKTLAAPYGHTGLKFIPLGGVTAATLADYLGAPNVAAVGGSWIADRSLIKAGDWAGITKLAREAVAIAKSVDIL